MHMHLAKPQLVVSGPEPFTNKAVCLPSLLLQPCRSSSVVVDRNMCPLHPSAALTSASTRSVLDGACSTKAPKLCPWFAP